MHSRTEHDLRAAAPDGDNELAADTELSILRDVFRMLPGGVTVQDEQGRFLLVNDAAAAQLGIAASEPAGLPRSNWTSAAKPALNCCAPAAPRYRKNSATAAR